MDDIKTAWDNLPTWAKWVLPIVAVGIIVIIWAPWKNKSNTQTLPSGLNAGGNGTSYLTPIATQTGLGSNSQTSNQSSGMTGNQTGIPPYTPIPPITIKPITYPTMVGDSPVSTNQSSGTTSRISEISRTFTNASPDTTGGTSFQEQVSPTKNVVYVHNNQTGANYTQTLNSYFNYLHNPVGSLGSQYTHGQQVADTLYYHYGIKNNAQLLQALNNSSNPAHNVAVEFHNILQSNAG